MGCRVVTGAAIAVLVTSITFLLNHDALDTLGAILAGAIALTALLWALAPPKEVR